MKGTNAFAAVAALTIGLAAPARAQQAVEPGDKVFVTGRNGAPSQGRVLRISPSELVLVVDKEEQVIPSTAIGRIEKGDSLWNGMLRGAAPFALLGGAAAGASCSPDCGRDIPLGMLVFGAIGAGIGAVVDSRIRGYSIVEGPPLASPNARRSPAPVTALDQLWLRVRSGDTITVVTRSGEKVSGKFVQVSSDSVTMTVRGVRRGIRASEVRRATRSGNRYRSGALWGGAMGAVAGVAAAAGCSGGGCGNPFFAAMVIGSAGAAWGSAIGAAIPKHPVVYETETSPVATRVMPVIGRGRVGVALSKTF